MPYLKVTIKYYLGISRAWQLRNIVAFQAAAFVELPFLNVILKNYKRASNKITPKAVPMPISTLPSPIKLPLPTAARVGDGVDTTDEVEVVEVLVVVELVGSPVVVEICEATDEVDSIEESNKVNVVATSPSYDVMVMLIPAQ